MTKGTGSDANPRDADRVTFEVEVHRGTVTVTRAEATGCDSIGLVVRTLETLAHQTSEDEVWLIDVATILADRGEDVVGVWMRLVPGGADSDAPRCCGTDEAGEDARRAAAALGIPFYALDYADVFGERVVDPFVNAYAAGETPNPCVACNQHLKFDALLAEGPADMVLDGVVVLVDRRVDGPRLLMGDVAALAGTEVLFRDPRVGVVREIA